MRNGPPRGGGSRTVENARQAVLAFRSPTTFALGLLEISSVASIPFQAKSLSLMPSRTYLGGPYVMYPAYQSLGAMSSSASASNPHAPAIAACRTRRRGLAVLDSEFQCFISLLRGPLRRIERRAHTVGKVASTKAPPSILSLAGPREPRVGIILAPLRILENHMGSARIIAESAESGALRKPFSTPTRIGACSRVEVRFRCRTRSRLRCARAGGFRSKFAHSCGQQTALWSHCGIEIDVHRNDSADLLNLVFANAC